MVPEIVGRGRQTTSVIRRKVLVQGHVQGVFFRESIRRRATAVGVAGWARNLPDGSLEVVLEGAPEAVESVVAFCQDGPRGARVDWVDVAGEQPEALTGFTVA